jgi:hypothetical protein
VREHIYRRLEHAARRADEDPGASLAEFSAELWYVVAEACQESLDEEVQARSCHPFTVDQTRRDSGLFLLQHRLLEPAFAHPDERREAVLRRYTRP